MGGPGSGRLKSQHRVVESCLVLDINQLAVQGCLTPGWVGTGQWTAGDGCELYSLILRAETDRLHLAHPRPDGITAETIPFERRPNYFGSRPYFLCPGNSASPEAGCGRRVLKLYLMHSQFRCRYCHQLVYASPYERPWERAFRRANMLRQQIDSNAGLDGVPEKPDDMPVEVYARLLDEILQAETQAYQARADWTRRFVAWVVDRTKPEFTL